jgi:hypothetical protein
MINKRFWNRAIILSVTIVLWCMPLLPAGVQPAFAFTAPILDGRLDDVYLEYGTITRYYDAATHAPTGQSDVAAAYLYLLEDENYVYIFYHQDMYYANDNSYGDNSIHWESRKNGIRNFEDIVESDMGEFIFEDAYGGLVAHLYVDQIESQSGTPSGYDCLGFSGGEGQWLAGYGDPSYFEVTSAMDYNLNHTGYCSGGACSCGSTTDLLSNSPLASGSYGTTEPACDQWQWYNGWEIRVDKLAFAPLGFGIVIGNHHNSPSKMCSPASQCPADLHLADSSVGDRVWYDLDGDGLQDPDEPGLQGVRVNLIDPRDGRLIESQLTGSDGGYLFEMLVNEYYIVQVDETTLPSGFASTNQEVSDFHETYVNDVCAPSDCIQRDGATYTRIYYIDLDQNEHYRTADFGYRPSGSAIGDYVWSDADNDGVQDPGEPGIDNVVLELLDETGTVLSTTTTDAAGHYLFTALSAGNYRVRVAASNFDPGGSLEGYSHSPGPQSSSSPTVLIPLGSDEQYLNADFGYYRAGLGTIGDYVWFDADNEGDQDAGEVGAGGVTLDLYVDSDEDGEIDAGEPVIAEAITDGSGSYLFSGLVLDRHYLVKVSDRDGVLDGFEITTYWGDDPGDPLDLDRYNDPCPVHLTAADPNWLYADFGYNRDGAIGDTVWFDWDQDGIQDPGEIGVGGVAVALSGADSGNTSTDADGHYLYTELPTGNYQVQITIPSGYSLSAGTPNNPHSCALSGNESYLNADFGLWRSDAYTIGDTVWHDADADGLQDGGETGIAGVTLALFEDTDGDGVLDPTEPRLGTTTTDADGHYTFYGVTNGNYLAVVTDRDGILEGYRQTAGLDPWPVEINGASRDDIDWGYVRDAEIGSIGDYVWYDTDGDGQQDVTESGIANVALSLYGDTNGNGSYDPGTDQLLESTVTAADGTYSFPNLPAGGYFVVVDSANFVAGGPLEGTSSTTGGEIHGAIALSEGQDYLDADFGYRGNGYSLGDYVWSDADQDGIQDPGEPAIGGVLLELLDGAGVPTGDTTTTLADGSYLFSDLLAGAYSVRVASSNFDPGGPLEGYTVTFGPQSEGSDTSRTVTFVEDGDPTNDSVDTLDFGYYLAGLGSIGNLVWFDSNADGDLDAGEPGLAGVTVDLIWDLDEDGVWDVGEPVITDDTTDQNGQYQFVGLDLDDGNADGDFDYLVVVSDRSGVLAGLLKSSGVPDTNDNSQANPYAVVLSSGTTSVQYADFGYYGSLGTIGDYVWHDADHDGLQDAGESGFQGVEIHLYHDVDGDGEIDPGMDNQLRTTTTDANGRYLFTGLALDSYIVRVASSNFASGGILEGFAATLQDQGGDDAADSDGDPVLYTAGVELTSANRNDPTIDFGYYTAEPSYALGNLVWEDTSNDGHKDSIENGIDGITLVLHRDLDGDGVLDAADPIIGRTTTSGGGLYSFPNLPNGTYIVQVTDEDNLLASHTWTDGLDNTDNESQVTTYAVTISDGDVLYADFGFYIDDDPTSVSLVSFTATPEDGSILLEWETASEINNLGFYLYRAESPDGPQTQINESPIPSKAPGSPGGALYDFSDNMVSPDITYYYWLEALDIYAGPTMHGPVEATIQSYTQPVMQYRIFMPVMMNK